MHTQIADRIILPVELTLCNARLVYEGAQRRGGSSGVRGSGTALVWDWGGILGEAGDGIPLGDVVVSKPTATFGKVAQMTQGKLQRTKCSSGEMREICAPRHVSHHLVQAMSTKQLVSARFLTQSKMSTGFTVLPPSHGFSTATSGPEMWRSVTTRLEI
jgi:hypothetical protein